MLIANQVQPGLFFSFFFFFCISCIFCGHFCCRVAVHSCISRFLSLFNLFIYSFFKKKKYKLLIYDILKENPTSYCSQHLTASFRGCLWSYIIIIIIKPVTLPLCMARLPLSTVKIVQILFLLEQMFNQKQ